MIEGCTKMSSYYKARDIFNAIDTIIQNATETDAEVIANTGLVIEINKLPTMEVGNGEWLFEEYPDGYYYSECSICKHWFIEDAFLRPYKYCPNCGSKMKG